MNNKIHALVAAMSLVMTALTPPAEPMRGVIEGAEIRSVQHLNNRVLVRLQTEQSICAEDYYGFHAAVPDDQTELIENLFQARLTRTPVDLVVLDVGDCNAFDNLMQILEVNHD